MPEMNTFIMILRILTWKYFTRIFSLFRSPSNSRSGSFLFKMITLEGKLDHRENYNNSAPHS